MNKKSEILAPAGSQQALKAAVLCGADAVYLGVEALNARRSAENFTLEISLLNFSVLLISPLVLLLMILE